MSVSMAFSPGTGPASVHLGLGALRFREQLTASNLSGSVWSIQGTGSPVAAFCGIPH
jgi:hypothetical protein